MLTFNVEASKPSAKAGVTRPSAAVGMSCEAKEILQANVVSIGGGSLARRPGENIWPNQAGRVVIHQLTSEPLGIEARCNNRGNRRGGIVSSWR